MHDIFLCVIEISSENVGIINLVSNLVLKMEIEIRNPGTISEVGPGTLEVEPKTRQLGF